jgi:hypothetical protein
MLSIVPQFSLPQLHRLSITHFGSHRENSLGKIPENSRLIGKSVPVGDGSKHYRQTLYVIWDKAQGMFKLFESFLWLDFEKDKKYKTSKSTNHEATLNHGDVLGADFIPGTIVDQVNQKLILPDGRQIDGPTGDILDVHGRRILARDPEVHQKLRESEKEC